MVNKDVYITVTLRWLFNYFPLPFIFIIACIAKIKIFIFFTRVFLAIA